MREAKLHETAECISETPKPEPMTRKVHALTKSAVALSSPKTPPSKRQAKSKAKNGSGKRFVPNKTKGRPHTAKAHLTNEARKPWEAMKISRRTWYRKIAKDLVK
jgi:hypothetical protein